MTIQFTINDCTGLSDRRRNASVKVDNLICTSETMDFANALVNHVKKFTDDYLKGEDKKGD